MKDKTIVTLARIAAGAAIFITSMITGVNGVIQSAALLLLGLPVEGLIKDAETADKENV